MTLTKKHFKAIAEILNNTEEETLKLVSGSAYKKDLIVSFIHYFRSENALFDTEKFLNAVNKTA